MKIKCIVIDDEKLARDYIKTYIAKIPQMELVGDFNSPLKAMELIKNQQVDLLFLDIQMPDITGVEFMKSLQIKPEVIFTTAYQEYALEGFNLSAVDYLLKPFSFERFFQAVNKVIDKFENKAHSSHAPDAFPATTTFTDNFLTIRADRKYYKINFKDIKYIEGQKAYVTFHTSAKRITALISLKELEESLPKEQFIRIHKSYIVSINEIASLEGNTLEVDEQQLPVGKSYKDAVLEIFGV